MIDLSKLDPSEAERIAHAEGFTGVSELYSRLSDAESLNAEHERQLEELRDTLYQCLPFFEDWKDEDGVYKPKMMDFMIRMIRKSLGEALK
jgi:hypothetical protein